LPTSLLLAPLLPPSTPAPPPWSCFYPTYPTRCHLPLLPGWQSWNKKT
jgi:hypothetical protein